MVLKFHDKVSTQSIIGGIPGTTQAAQLVVIGEEKREEFRKKKYAWDVIWSYAKSGKQGSYDWRRQIDV